MASPDANQLSDGRPAGTKLGQNASDLVGLHGVDPVAQAAAITSLSTTVYTATTTVVTNFGFSTSADFIALTTALNSLIIACRNKGILAA